MDRHTSFRFGASSDYCTLSLKEFSEHIDHLDVFDRNVLLEYYGDEDEMISYQWIYRSKNTVMHQVSSLLPDLRFYLYIDGEDWTETWKHGKRTEFNKLLPIDNFMMNELEKEFPEIYQRYLKKFYATDSNFSSYDDRTIIVNGFEVENTRYQEF
jgi:hypothetical protein